MKDIQLPAHPDCFICDVNHPLGMGARWFGRADHQSLYGTVTISDRFVGPPDHAHGGASAAILDDIMGTCAWFAGYQVMTAKMTVDYRLPVPLNQPLTVEAMIEKVVGRKVYIKGWLKLPDARIATESEGLFIVIPEAFVNDASGRFARMKLYAQDVAAARHQASN